MKNMLEICRGCFGASFNDCEECPTMQSDLVKKSPKMERSACDTCPVYNSGIPCGVEPGVCKVELDVNEMKMYTDIHKEEEHGKEEKIL